MKVFFIVYGIKIHNESSAYEDIGSYANCWIQADTFEEADLIARRGIEEHDWKVEALRESKEVSRDDYINDIRNLEHYDEGVRLGAFYNITTHPKKKGKQPMGKT